MAQTAMTVRLDTRVKSQFDSLCEQFGMSANAAINVFINAVVRTRAIPFTISASEAPTRKRALDTFYAADRSNRPELTIDEINEEIRAARRERKERMQKAQVWFTLLLTNGVLAERTNFNELFVGEDDHVFYEVALSEEDSFLVTGNLKHYPIDPRVVTPTQMLQILEEE